MTYEQAKELKRQLPKKFTYKDLSFTTYIVPKHEDDYKSFRIAVNTLKIDDALSTLHNTHNDYNVIGICFFRDANLFYTVQLPLPE